MGRLQKIVRSLKKDISSCVEISVSMGLRESQEDRLKRLGKPKAGVGKGDAVLKALQELDEERRIQWVKAMFKLHPGVAIQ